jgi:phage-related protein
VTVIIDGLIAAFPLLLDAALELLLAIVQAIPEIVALLIKEVPTILEAILSILAKLPELLWSILLETILKLANWVVQCRAEAKEGGKKILEAAIEAIKQLPEKMWNYFTQTVSRVVKFGTDAASKAKTAAKSIFDAIVNGLKSLPGEIMSIGSDIVRGLWEGISDMAGWISEKIQGFGSGVLNGIKNFFGINSPSRVFRDEVGKMLAAGLAEGIEKNAAEPLAAMADLSRDVLGEADAMNGLTLERKMLNTFAAPEAVSVAESGMLAKLDKILEAIERGQVLTIDGKTLVGSTANRMDSTLGQRRALVARGAV